MFGYKDLRGVSWAMSLFFISRLNFLIYSANLIIKSINDSIIAKLSPSFSSAGLSLALMFISPPTHPQPPTHNRPPDRNSKNYTFREAEIWHTNYIGPHDRISFVNNNKKSKLFQIARYGEKIGRNGIFSIFDPPPTSHSETALSKLVAV